MKKEIFIALNDFNTPNNLATYGAHFAKQLDRYAFLFGVTKVQMHTPPTVINGTSGSNSLSAHMNSKEIKAEKKLQAISLEVEKIYPHVYYDTGIGFTEPTIIEKSEKQPPYMILLEGSSEPTDLHEWFGTYETRLAEDTGSPALIVPEKYSWDPIKTVLYIMDLDDEKVENMRYLSELTKELDARLVVVMITGDATENGREKFQTTTKILKGLLGYEDIPFHQVLTKNSAEAVEKMMQETNADCLAFEHKSRSFLERVFWNYNTKHLILNSEKPVLVF